jgi:hypothetical protein
LSLINADDIIGILADYRLCWISGRFSGGKTSFAYRAAYEYLKKGYRLVTTNASCWGDELDSVRLLDCPDNPKLHNKLHCVCLLDEGGLYFKSTKQIEQVAAYAAKMDVIYMIPSFFPPVRSAQVVTVQPIFGLRAAGIPLIVYKWRAHIGGFDDSGFFLWWWPQEVYGVYSRQDPGAEPDDVVAFLIKRMEEYKAAYGRNKVSDVGGGWWQTSDADAFTDAAATFADAADAISLSKRGRGRK